MQNKQKIINNENYPIQNKCNVIDNNNNANIFSEKIIEGNKNKENNEVKIEENLINNMEKIEDMDLIKEENEQLEHNQKEDEKKLFTVIMKFIVKFIAKDSI